MPLFINHTKNKNKEKNYLKKIYVNGEPVFSNESMACCTA